MSVKFNNSITEFRHPVSNETFSAVITGDCCPWQSATEKIQAGDTADILNAVKPFILEADLRIIQFESPLTDANTPIDKSGPNLKCPPECLDLALAADFNVALLANNHIGDHGTKVVMETIKRFNDAGIKTVGAGKNLAEAGLPLNLECHGLSVALLNFAENEFGTAKQEHPGCAPLDPLENIKAIRATSQNADLVFVVIHGGHERNPVPSPRMIKTYRAFADAGAAAVINIHTHCPEGIELWHGVPIIYSPGNFFFPWDDLSSDHLNAMWWTGYLPKFHCDRDGVYALEIMPCRFDNERTYLLTPAEQQGFFTYLSHLSELIVDPSAVRRYFEAWTAHHGSMYLGWLRDRLAAWPIDLTSRDAVRELLPVRNIFTCESHHDMISLYLRLVEEGRAGQALQLWEEIAEMQAPDWAENHWKKLRHEEQV
jgi:poly-gamma-glutamate synthesis protein (capsule biosynthesis protein)